MPREKMDGENLREGVVEVAFEQWTEQRENISFLVGSNVFPALAEAVSEKFPY